MLEGSVDAIERACPAEQRAALRALRWTGQRAGGFEPLQAAASLAGAESAAAFALAAWELAWRLAGQPGREPRLSRAMADQLARSARQLDRLEGRPVSCRDLVDDIADVAWGDPETGGEIGTLAYYAVSLRQQARALRRAKRGAPPPRPWKPRGRQ